MVAPLLQPGHEFREGLESKTHEGIEFVLLLKIKTAQCWSTERNTKYLKGYFMSEIIALAGIFLASFKEHTP